MLLPRNHLLTFTALRAKVALWFRLKRGKTFISSEIGKAVRNWVFVESLLCYIHQKQNRILKDVLRPEKSNNKEGEKESRGGNDDEEETEGSKLTQSSLGYKHIFFSETPLNFIPVTFKVHIQSCVCLTVIGC